jgi:hypothetical protein
MAGEASLQLRIARLCLDCEELHDQKQCPVCASESFTYLTRWVPVPERRFKPRDVSAPPDQRASPSRHVTYGLLGLAAAGAAGWWWRTRQRLESAAESGAGELK